MKKEKSADREDRIISENLSAQNRIWGAKSVGDYFEIFILLLGLAANIITKKKYPKRYKLWVAISSVLIFASFLTSTLFVKPVF